MKKLLSLLLMLFMGMTMWAETVDFSAQDYSNGQVITEYVGEDFTVTFDKGTNSNTPKYYTTGAAIRVYGGGYFTVASSTKTISKIEVGFGSGDGTNEITTDVVTYSDGVWEGSASSVQFTIGGTSGHRRIKTLNVTFSGETPPPATYYSVTLPNSLTGGTVTANVSNLTQIAEGTTVIITATPETGYELDWMKVNDEEVTNPYSFTINEDKIVTAAFKEKSITEVSTVAEFNALADDVNFKFTGTLIVSGQTGSYLYAQDATGGILIYGSVGQTYNKLDVIPINWTGIKTTYKGAPEVKDPANFTEATTQANLAPEEMTPAQVTLENAFKYAIIKNATIENNKAVVDDEEVALYNRFGVSNPTDGGIYDIIGVTGWYNSAQFMPLEFIGTSEPPTPTITEIATAAEFIALENNKEFKFTGSLICVQDYTAGNNRYLYVADETGGIVIYNPDASTPAYETKDIIPGGWTATKTTYRNLPEATGAKDFGEAEGVQHLEPIEMTIDEVNTSTNYGAYIIIKNVLIRPQSDNMLMEESGPSTHDESIMITDGNGNNIVLYSNHTAPFNLPTDWETDTRYDIVGILGVYNTTQQIFPIGIKLNDETITSIENVNTSVKKITYCNTQGMSNDKPFDGMNIIVIEYENGTKKVNKRVYKF